MKNSTIIFLFLNLYRFLWWLALPILKKNARLHEGLKERTSSDHLKKADIWIQGASAGESNLTVQLVEKLHSEIIIKEPIINNRYSNQPPKILLTSTTAQGISILSRLKMQSNILLSKQKNFINITWFPFDIPDLMERVICKVKPALIVLIETELWPSLLFAAKKYGVKVIVVNGRLSKKSHRNYMLTRWLWNKLQPDTILAISDRDAQKFRDIFPASYIDVMPNMKFDSILYDSEKLNLTLPSDIKILPIINKASQTIKRFSFINVSPANTPISILASVRREEEDDVIVIIDQIIKKFPRQLICLFPRHQHRIDFWKKTLTKKEQKWILRSDLEQFRNKNIELNKLFTATNNKDNNTAKEVLKNNSQIEGVSLGTVILWDIFGELKDAYAISTSTVAFVGGSLKPLGGHNFIEPLIAGVPTVTGPFTDDFAWVGEELFNNCKIFGDNIIKRAESRDEVINFMVNSLTSTPNKSDIINKSIKYIEKKQGGTSIVCNTIKHYI
ncbi:MAG: hypothetical protein HQK69_01515 [Desulfamplus sp.]|nr:hypothetical protein [Desulfamplus sp.]